MSYIASYKIYSQLRAGSQTRGRRRIRSVLSNPPFVTEIWGIAATLQGPRYELRGFTYQ